MSNIEMMHCAENTYIPPPHMHEVMTTLQNSAQILKYEVEIGLIRSGFIASATTTGECSCAIVKVIILCAINLAFLELQSCAKIANISGHGVIKYNTAVVYMNVVLSKHKFFFFFILACCLTSSSFL